RLHRHQNRGPRQAPAPERARRLPQSEHLGAGGRIAAHLPLVARRRDDLAVECDHASDRHVLVLQGALRLADGEPHEVLVPGEEDPVHVPVTSRRPTYRSAARAPPTNPRRSATRMPAASVVIAVIRCLPNAPASISSRYHATVARTVASSGRVLYPSSRFALRDDAR